MKKVLGKKIELLPKKPKENEVVCDTCGGIGWLYNKKDGCIEKCTDCYGGVICLCPDCGKPLKGLCMEVTCRKRREETAEQKKLKKAIKISYEDTPDEAKEMMYSDAYPYNEGYFHEIEDLQEHCDDNQIPFPPYVWSTQKIGLVIDAWGVIENACDDLHDDAMDSIDNIAELQSFLDDWCAKQTGTDTYFVNYKYAIATR